jgi:hypothetical protein
VGESAERVVATMQFGGNVQFRRPRFAAQGVGHDRDVGEPVAPDIALELPTLARAGLDRHHATGSPDPSRGKQREQALVGADVDECHARTQQAVEEGKLIGLEGARDVQAEAVVVAQRDLDPGAAVPGHRQAHVDVALEGELPQRAAPHRQPAPLDEVLVTEHPAGEEPRRAAATDQRPGVGACHGWRVQQEPTAHPVEPVAGFPAPVGPPLAKSCR